MKLLILPLLVTACAAQFNANFKEGRTTIVHLFEWRWDDIAEECERYLGPNGFAGVQISPPNENVVITDPSRPWWERYQPISYKICTRSGDEQQFRDMVTRCNNVGVFVYADAVINHMCGSGYGKETTCGSPYNAETKDFPAVPYSYRDFNDGKCKNEHGAIENYEDEKEVRDCRLENLLDLATGKDYVRGKIAEYMNHLIDIGVAGFRYDASKHMWPGDLKAISQQLHNLNTQWFPSGARPFIYQEVIDLGGEKVSADQYLDVGFVTEFKYGVDLGAVIRKLEGKKMADLKNWGEEWGLIPHYRALAFTDNHDNQRGHGAGGSSILTFFEARSYKMAVGFMLAHPYGLTRVMSSYSWPRTFVDGEDIYNWIGPPMNPDGSIKHVPINADSTCGDDWVCEHRWRQIKNMVIFRNTVNFQPLTNWWDNGGNQIAFGRGDKGFIVFNNEEAGMDVTLNTGLPAGTYCDVISGQKEETRCTGIEINVSDNGSASFRISNLAEDPFVAIHVGAKL
ncbi:pancreatic alpha-amylase-like [Dendropsophus ebraccatus]|uniref:pancreatic alpha-amylase-like n=1 Tax=Dendropsophus ebraccatus TaxID=150705 RepID=UPI0038312C0C